MDSKNLLKHLLLSFPKSSACTKCAHMSGQYGPKINFWFLQIFLWCREISISQTLRIMTTCVCLLSLGASDWPCKEESHQSAESDVPGVWWGWPHVWHGIWYEHCHHLLLIHKTFSLFLYFQFFIIRSLTLELSKNTIKRVDLGQNNFVDSYISQLFKNR